jgi:dihydrofolate synthase/folylpolyglutamate synthase
MSYAAAVDHLYALGHELAPPSPGAPRRKFDLAHMRILAAALGNPQTSFPSILIAGTNGKGSTAATLASILTAAGYRTGLYTSPHLIRVNERIQIDGVPISDEDFARLYFFHVDETARHLVNAGDLPHPPSVVETLTALALLYFAGNADQAHSNCAGSTAAESGKQEVVISTAAESDRQEVVISTGTQRSGETRFSTPSAYPVDIAILEVGLGGRLDATNIVDPLLSIITDIALDHQDYLGDTITEITREKAGILRPNGTLITLPQHPEANQAIGEAATTLNVRAISAASFIPPQTPSSQSSRRSIPPQPQHVVISTEAAQRRSGETRFSTSTPDVPHPEPPLPRNHYTLTLDNRPLEIDSPLPGQHQQRNIALAIAAAIELRNLHGYKSTRIYPTRNKNSYKITNQAIETGIRNTNWPGRLELLTLKENRTLLLDVAHNPAGAWTLRAAIAQLPESQPRTLLFSCLRDKNLKEMAQILFPLFDATSGDPARRRDHILFAPIDNPRATSLDDLQAVARSLDIPAETAPNLAAAFEQAQTITPPNGIILATGSVYLVGEIRHLAEQA